MCRVAEPALIQTAGTAIVGRGQADRLDVLGYVLLAIGGLVLANRHRHPVATAVIVAGTTVAYHAMDYPSGPTLVAAAIGTLSLMKAGRYDVVAGTAFTSYVVWLLFERPTVGRGLLLLALLVGLFVVFGMAAEFGKLLERMGEEQRRLRAERQARQASEERLRIARELHDVLGHHLSLINVRAGVGRHLMDREPEQARAALDTIKQASAEALQEVQAVLNALRPAGEAAPLAPAPGLDRLDELTADAGLPVRTAITGQTRALPAEVDRAAYRIVQEALTNVRRHAGPGATAEITIDFKTDLLLLHVEDDGRRANALSAVRNGITGMRERATALGGTLSAGPRADGAGWRVLARLPLSGMDTPS